jgi:hypothetical protein
MNHLAFDVATEPSGACSIELHPGVFVRRVYFLDPDGILLEFARRIRPLGQNDVNHEPASAEVQNARAPQATP